MNKTAFEIHVYRVWDNKRKNAFERGIEFDLSLISVRNMLRAKRCYYTGIPLTHRKLDKNGKVLPGQRNKPNHMTIERIDATKGYVKGNVVACSLQANKVKSVFENPSSLLKVEHFCKMVRKMEKRK